MNTSEDQYHADAFPDPPSLSNSIIKVLLNKTPYHAWLAHPRLNPGWEPEGDKDSFDIGTVAHGLLLEGMNKAKMLQFDDWRTKAAREARDECRLQGLIPLLPKHYEQVMTLGVKARDFMKSAGILGLFESGTKEETLRWKIGQNVLPRETGSPGARRHLHP